MTHRIGGAVMQKRTLVVRSSVVLIMTALLPVVTTFRESRGVPSMKEG